MDSDFNYITACGFSSKEHPPLWGPGMRDVYLFHYVIEGCGYLNFGHKQIKITEGECFLIMPHMFVHYYPDPDTPWKYAWVDFRGSGFEKLISQIRFKCDNSIIAYSPKEVILPYLHTLEEAYSYSKKSLYCEGIFRTILGYLADRYPNDHTNINSERYSNAVEIIKNKFSNPDFNVKDIASALNLSSSTLYRIFINMSGISPNNYLMNFRIAKAKNLIDENLPTKHAAISCGFKDPLYFSRVFRSVTGVSPKDYRKMSKDTEYFRESTFLID